MTVGDFVNAWNACCFHAVCEITAANLFNHNTNGLWGGGDIETVHLYGTIADANNVIGARLHGIGVHDFFVAGQTIQVSAGNPHVTSVYGTPHIPPINNPTRFCPQVMVFVS